jgi:hypothetical protein
MNIGDFVLIYSLLKQRLGWLKVFVHQAKGVSKGVLYKSLR